MPYDQIGKLLLGVGVAIVVIGLLFLLIGRFAPLGKLPGDISFSSGNFTCVAPIATMIILSLLLTIVLNVVLRLFNR